MDTGLTLRPGNKPVPKCLGGAVLTHHAEHGAKMANASRGSYLAGRRLSTNASMARLVSGLISVKKIPIS